jgi:hypothetical protein
MTTVRVKAVPGKMLPDVARKGAFVGYVECAGADHADHVVPGGRCYRVVEAGVDVADSGYIRRAVARGDIERVAVKAASPSKEK